MKSQAELLGEIASLLDEAQVRYMVTGSIASTYHGTPRATQGVDVVVGTNRDPLIAFTDACRVPCGIPAGRSGESRLHLADREQRLHAVAQRLVESAEPHSGHRADAVVEVKGLAGDS